MRRLEPCATCRCADSGVGFTREPGFRHRVTHASYSEPYDHLRRARDLGLRPQRGRLRGAGGPTDGGRVHARRRPGRRGHRGREHLRVRRAGQEGLRRHAARGGRPQGVRAHPGGRRGGLSGRAVRRRPRGEPARGRRGARLRRLPRHRRAAPGDPGRRGSPAARTSRPTPAAADQPGGTEGRRPISVPGHAPASLRDPARQGPDRQPQARQRLRPTLLPSARSRASAARSSAAGPARCSTRPAGWPRRAPASCSWSARTPPPTARTSATSDSSRRCCPSSPPSTASTGSASPTSSPPRPDPGWSRPSPARPA